jgi:hypothetical protein
MVRSRGDVMRTAGGGAGPLMLLRLSMRRSDGLPCASRGAAGADLRIRGRWLCTRRRGRVREVTPLEAGKLLLVQLGRRGSAHCRRRMRPQSVVVRRDPRMPVLRRHRRCGCPWSHRPRSHRCRPRCPLRQIRCAVLRSVRRWKIGRRGGGARPAGDWLIWGWRAHAGTGALCPDRYSKRKRGNDRNATQEMLHDFDPLVRVIN